ncbi:hypothetical protein C0J52_17479 [Blattella germanica]|nr:hypothetical protein C0J52_17479 [Blattella germanica]
MFFIAALLLVNSIFVKGQVCNVGESQVKNFELKRFLGLWHVDLISSEDFSNKFSCWKDDYILDGHAIYSSYYYSANGREDTDLDHS